LNWSSRAGPALRPNRADGSAQTTIAEDQVHVDPKTLASRRFGMPDQLRFAQLSGDHNPMHLDAVAARRTQPGAPVVHGMHAILWALDTLAEAGVVGGQLSAITVQFRKFMYLDRPLDLKLAQHDEGTVRAEVSLAGLVVASLLLRSGPRKVDVAGVGTDWPEVSTSANVPDAPTLEEAARLSGWMTPPASTGELARIFPHLAGSLGACEIAELASLSRLVGMICPGLHSIFIGFSVDLMQPTAGRAGVGFKVTLAHPRVRMINIDVAGRRIAGKVSAFMVGPPVAAPPMRLISNLVGAQDFAGAVALIVGGSRGLGAVAAKAIAAGGGSVIVTYARGRDDALELAEEINAARGEMVCTVLAYDSAGSAAWQLASLTDAVNQLYYFATPVIFQQKSEVFSSELFQAFSSVYIDGFYDVCRCVRSRSRVSTLSVLYPSSISVEKRPAGFTEYSMAKMAGELLCADLMEHVPGLRVLVGRLPRVLTDQTNTVAQVENADPLTVLLPVIRAVHRMT
jgi:NAD(P)-dependent dehydrogenase (short-subunit alcohol dehydrogenase family)/acyl dehydratase